MLRCRLPSTIAAMRLELGNSVRASDGQVVGELADVIVDPTQNRVTHLVVRPHHKADEGLHLVPIEQAVSGDDGREISLNVDSEAVRQLPNAPEFAYLPGGGGPGSAPRWDG